MTYPSIGSLPSTALDAAEAPNVHFRAAEWQTWRARCAHLGQGWKEGQPGQENAQKREEGRRLPRPQQSRL